MQAPFRVPAVAAGVTAFALSLGAAHVHAAWPDHPITIVVPTAPGGGNDAFARVIAQKMGETLKQTVIVVNRAGAQGAIASEYVARAPGDGYTILFGYIATHGINPALQKLRYDPVKDFKPIGMLASSPTLLVVSSGAGVNSVQELIAKAKKEPDSLSYASAGLGTAPHVTAELFKMVTGTSMLHVPYKGSAPAMTDTLAGTTQVMFPSLFSAYPHLASGKIKALALAGDRRSEVLKDVPTLEELGVKGVSVPQWYALFAPASTDQAIVDQLNKALNTALRDPEVIAKFKEQGADPQSSSPQELGEFVKSEVARWKKVVEAAKLSAD
ncbi:MAG: tripartite tricarboxylate transporter substrate binding protein [Pigmentiphaga sp.]|uniref:Bug family tripartite tricarboxylate transporter substrate binding protein n=1 Tax=Pigmentiphaga sp. TaxID=1977564 RepID=UPI0029AC84EB|nr:tripartite tricarboxylate transporter substrate binding protein [Pigmentiphaga sp.]MDX3906561.1 tripartite tricarboxylate transporter substrate binding protein [Pigmentiphaga sp.]